MELNSVNLRKNKINLKIIPPRSQSEMKPKDKGTVYLKAKPSELKSVLENILGSNLKGQSHNHQTEESSSSNLQDQ